MTHLSASARDAIDASSKTVLRDLNASIRQLASAEEIRRDTEARVSARKHAKGVLGRWAAGASGGAKSPEQAVEEARREAFAMHRDSVLWYLGRRLEGVGEVQRGMMERRLEREVERGRSVLYKFGGGVGAGEGTDGVGTRGGAGGGLRERAGDGSKAYRGGGGVAEDESRREIEQQLSPEQLQLFARENQDMLKQYEDTLDQVRSVPPPPRSPPGACLLTRHHGPGPPNVPCSRSPSCRRPWSRTSTSRPPIYPSWSPTRCRRRTTWAAATGS